MDTPIPESSTICFGWDQKREQKYIEYENWISLSEVVERKISFVFTFFLECIGNKSVFTPFYASYAIEFLKSVNIRLVPGLKNMPVPVLLTRKFRYTNRTAPLKRPFLLAGEFASPAGRVLVVLVLVLACFFRPGTLLECMNV